MKFQKITYKGLKPKQQEIFNFQKVAGVLADYGFNCIKLADDWHGADFLAYHKDGFETLKVQLKSRLTIDRKYQGKGLYIAFPNKEHWYLVDHDLLVEKVGECTKHLQTKAWKDGGLYHSRAPGIRLMKSLIESKL